MARGGSAHNSRDNCGTRTRLAVREYATQKHLAYVECATHPTSDPDVKVVLFVDPFGGLRESGVRESACDRQIAPTGSNQVAALARRNV